MLGFLHRSGMRSPSSAMLRALVAGGMPSGTLVSTLGVVESPGTSSGRKVTYFRVFDRQRAVARAVNVLTRHAYEDLNAHLDLVLRSGFIERDGTIVLYARRPSPDAAIPARQPADRAAHPDDEKFVFSGKGPAGSQKEARS
jgi:hypothetical protein